jgi:biotin carboxylase
LARLNSQQLIKTPQFQRLLQEKLPGSTVLTYKTLDVPKSLVNAGLRFLGARRTLTRKLESKAAFRALCADIVPFPMYKIVESNTALEQATALLHRWGVVVLQDENLSGGRGTFVVRTDKELRAALASIAKQHGGRRLVVSKLVDRAYERSVQAVVTRFGVFVGPLQKQIIGNALLANLQVPDGDRFCGAEIAASDPCAGAYEEIRSYAERIGRRIQAMGYKGIFSVDCLVDSSGKVFVLEINPRITGITPLLTLLYRQERDIPFLLLHVLELMGAEYALPDTTIDKTPVAGSLLVLHSPHERNMRILRSPASGIYDFSSHDFLGKRYRFVPADSAKRLLVQQFAAGFEVLPAWRIMNAYVNGRVLDDHDALLPETAEAVEWLKQQTVMEELA